MEDSETPKNKGDKDCSARDSNTAPSAPKEDSNEDDLDASPPNYAQ